MRKKKIRKIIKNSSYRVLVHRLENFRLVHKFICAALTNIHKNYVQTKSVNCYINSFFYTQRCRNHSGYSIIKNICTQTGRYRGILSFFKLSRFKLKELSSMALLPGVRKSS